MFRRLSLVVSALVVQSLFANMASAETLTLTRDRRLQSFNRNTKSDKDIYDGSIYSPKSAAFSGDGKKLYVNSLEGGQTIVYNWPELTHHKVIDHQFTLKNQYLFNGETTVFNYKYFQTPENVNVFRGKPVEMAFSHGGKYLWVTYYRRDYDSSAQSPSAVAIIDTEKDSIIRVMPTGPIPKFVSVSPDGKRVAITHWGDNTIGIIDISSSSPSDFRYTGHLTVEKQLSQEGMESKDRDVACGFCLRGTVFSSDSRYMFVARMCGGGLAVFDLQEQKYLGSIMDFQSTPRHLAVTPDQQSLLLTSNQTGYLTKANIEDLVRSVLPAKGRRISGVTKQEVFVGGGARTMEIDPMGRYAYVAVNNGVKVVAVDIHSMQKVAEVGLDPYPVGLAISKDGDYLAITSQGRRGSGGNAVNIVRIHKMD